jgi:hypothetical protein
VVFIFEVDDEVIVAVVVGAFLSFRCCRNFHPVNIASSITNMPITPTIISASSTGQSSVEAKAGVDKLREVLIDVVLDGVSIFADIDGFRNSEMRALGGSNGWT